MENNKQKIKIKHRILATICLALFCGAVFISHYQPIKTYADNNTDTDYRMPSGVNVSLYSNTDIKAIYPLYAYTMKDNFTFYTAMGDDVFNLNVDYIASNRVQAYSNQSPASLQSTILHGGSSGDLWFNNIEITISDFYCDKFNHSTSVPITMLITDEGAGALTLADVYISYDVFNFENGYYQTVTQTLTDFDLSVGAITVNRVFSLSYFPSDSNKMLHFKDITVLVQLDSFFTLTSFFMNIEFYRATNDAINTFNDLLYEHTWEEVEVSVNYLQSFYDTLSGFLAIELLPHFTIGTMLELAIAIPLVVWFLKSWLGG